MQTLPFSTLNQFTYREPEEIRQRLKEFLYTGGNDPHFMKGICWMQIRQEFEGVAFLKPYDYQYDLENLFEKTFWTPWHFRLLKEFCQFFGKAKWCRFCRMAKELDRRKGLEQLDFHTLANFIYACLLEAKQTEDRELRTECFMDAVSALRELNWQERALLHQQLNRQLKRITATMKEPVTKRPMRR